MFKKYRILSAPFAFCATSLILVIAMLVPGISLPARSVIVADAAPAVVEIVTADEPTSKGAESEAKENTDPEADGNSSVRPAGFHAIEKNAPSSLANDLIETNPQLEQQIRQESAALPDGETTLPVKNFIMYNLTDEEYRLLCWCVEGEAHGKSMEHRCIIAQVIFNRVFNDRFPNTVKDVILSPNQFSVMSWYNPKLYDGFVTAQTEEAVNAVLNGDVEDMSQGALYFCNPTRANNVEWFDNALVTLFEFENHRFYTAP